MPHNERDIADAPRKGEAGRESRCRKLAGTEFADFTLIYNEDE